MSAFPVNAPVKPVAVNIPELELNVKFIKSILIKYGLNYHDQNLSWHYHLFAGFKRKFEERNIKIDKILEIGMFTGYSALGLSTFFTSGPEESRAWTIEKNSKAADAAGVIHTDFKKKFIRAETASHEDFIKYEGFNECKNVGKLRLEGKDYIVKDGDVMFFRTGA